LEASRSAGRLLYESGDLDSALGMYEQALKVDPRDQESVRARKNLAAEGALKKSGLADAEKSRDLMRDADAQKKQEKKARLQLTEDEINSELDELEAKLQGEPQDLATLKRVAELHVMRRDPQAALDVLEVAIQVAPDDPDLASRASDLRIRVQEKRVQDAVARGDEAAADQCRRVLAEMRVGEFRRRVERQPNDLGLRFDLGQALFESSADVGESLDQSITELQKAVQDPRRQVQARVLLGQAFHRKGLLDLAQKQLQDALSSGSLDGSRQNEILYELGSVQSDNGDADAALQSFGRILEADFGFRDTAQRVEALRAQAGG
ncbi:MAG: tetratricopeptide repeat protein, partial [Planctomycetota bacterium]